MKYLVYLITLYFIIINLVLANQNIDMTNKIISFNDVNNYNLQSFTVVDDSLIVILVSYDDSKGIIKEFSLKDFKEIKEKKIDKVGHGNGVTYNKNKLYILNGSGDDTIYVYDIKTLEYIENIKVNLPIRSITYNSDEDIYLVRTYITGYKLDNNFNLISKIPFINNLNANYEIARQDWTYYKGYIYYANWSWKRLGGDGANMIYVYNMKGKLLDILYTGNDIGELEDIAFYNNKMILGFNGYDDKINFYLEDLKNIQDMGIKKERKTENNNYNYKKYVFGIMGALLLLIIILVNIKRFKKVD